MAKVGEGHFAAMGRLGLKELRNAVNPSRESAADNEIGVYGTRTQGEIAQSRGGAGSGPEQEALDTKLSMGDLRAQAKDRADTEQTMDRTQGMER